MEIFFYSTLPDQTYYKLYKVEKEIFGNRYLICPSDFAEFCQKRPQKKIVAAIAVENDEIISCNVYEIINKYHAHGAVGATLKAYRQKGLFKRLCHLALDRLIKEGFLYFSFWTGNKFIPRIYSNYFERQEYSDYLLEYEERLLKEFCESRKIPLLDTKLRCVDDFYKMQNGNVEPSYFWGFCTKEEKK